MDVVDKLLKKHQRPWSVSNPLGPGGECIVTDATGKSLFYIDPDLFREEEDGEPTAMANDPGLMLAVRRLFK